MAGWLRVKKFALNMGKIDANCRVCVFNRLYLSTKLVSLWANHMSKNAKRILKLRMSVIGTRSKVLPRLFLSFNSNTGFNEHVDLAQLIPAFAGMTLGI